jgi:hypothetical protein
VPADRLLAFTFTVRVDGVVPLLGDAVRKLTSLLTEKAAGLPLVSMTVCAGGAGPPATWVKDSIAGVAAIAVALVTVYVTVTARAGAPAGVIVMVST